MSRGRFEAWTPAIGAIAFVALWWTVYRLRLVDPVLLPSPEDSVRAIWSGFVGGALLHDFLVTVRRTLLAFATTAGAAGRALAAGPDASWQAVKASAATASETNLFMNSPENRNAGIPAYPSAGADGTA